MPLNSYCRESVICLSRIFIVCTFLSRVAALFGGMYGKYRFLTKNALDPVSIKNNRPVEGEDNAYFSRHHEMIQWNRLGTLKPLKDIHLCPVEDFCHKQYTHRFQRDY